MKKNTIITLAAVLMLIISSYAVISSHWPVLTTKGHTFGDMDSNAVINWGEKVVYSAQNLIDSKEKESPGIWKRMAEDRKKAEIWAEAEKKRKEEAVIEREAEMLARAALKLIELQTDPNCE